MTRLTIAIVAFNARDDLAATLTSLFAAPPTTTHEIIVVDNASTEDVVGMIRARFPAVRVIEPGANVGFARANNVAIRESKSDLLLVLNPDTIVPPGAIDRLVALLDAEPGVAIVGPRIVDPEGRPERSFGDPVSPWTELARKVALRLDSIGVGSGGSRRTAARDVGWVTGACLLVRRADALAVGLLDERYFLYMEDVDFCAAIAARGRRVRFDPSVEVVHLRGRSRRWSGGAAERSWHASHLAYYRKHLPGWAPWLARYQRLRGIHG